jgi:arginase
VNEHYWTTAPLEKKPAAATTPRYAVLGVPSSAGAHWPGQERAPAALRAAGIANGHGFAVARDLGDLELRQFRPDPHARHARNLTAVREVAEDVAARIATAPTSARVLVIGGDCTVLIGVVAGLRRRSSEPLGLVYLDGHTDLNTPATSPSGILDSMGLAHLLGHGAPALTMLGPGFPMVDEEHVALIGFNGREINADERSALAVHRCLALPADEVRREPTAAAHTAADCAAAAGRFLVHFDVDVIDFPDLPVADVPQFSGGLPVAMVFEVLEVVLAHSQCVGLVITEFNPDRDRSGDYSRTFVARLADVLGRMPSVV